MPEALLTQREFDTWREGDERFKNELMTMMTSHQNLHLATEGRLASLEAKHEKASTQTINRTTWVSAVVAAIVGGLLSWAANWKFQ